MNIQEMFNRIWDHFIVRDMPFGVNHVGKCSYGGDDGPPCGVGLLMVPGPWKHATGTVYIKDPRIPFDMETNPAIILGAGEYFLLSEALGTEVDEEKYCFLADVQKEHDLASGELEGKLIFKSALTKLAKKFNLSVPGQ